MRLYILIFPVLLLYGCATTGKVTEGDRQLEGQIVQGAQKIAEESHEQTVVDIAKVVHADAVQLQDNHGKAERDLPFSADNSDAARKQSRSEHEAGAGWLAFVGLLGLGVIREVGVRWCPLLGPLMDAISPKLAGGSQQSEKALVAAHEVIDGAKDLVPAAKQEQLKNFMDRVNSRYGVAVHASRIYQRYVP